MHENETFLDGTKKPEPPSTSSSCCRSKHTFNCCIATAVIGGLFILLGLVAVLAGRGMLEEKILQSMALAPGSDRLESWLRPPVQPYLYGYGFHVTNVDEILRGGRPVVKERGPYVYRSINIKDADDNMRFSEDDSLLTYRLRKMYVYEPELSGPNVDPDRDVFTVPNVPLWTGLNTLRGKSGFAKEAARPLITNNGRGTPFINVTFSGLLWGYEDELPCLKLDRPQGCSNDEGPFSGGDDDGFGDDGFGDDGFGDDGFGDDGFGDDSFGDDGFDDDGFGDEGDDKKISKLSTDDGWQNPDEDPNSQYFGLAKPKAGFVNCSCNWGLFRDRNVTMRKPVEFYTGVGDLTRKGIVTKFDNSAELGWWRKGSQCDAVHGQDSSTLPPQLTNDTKLDVFISLMCRSLPLHFEKEVEHADIRTFRFIPPKNAMGAHDDPDPTRRNEDNECFCMEEEDFKCFKSGVLNMAPCKRETRAPLALSLPHFYQADPSYLEAVGGLDPHKDRHQFFMDVVPEFGFPLAIRPRFQLNLVIGSSIDDGWEVIKDMREEIVLPFLWAQDGFDEPSDEMADMIKMGLAAPKKLPLFVGVLCFVIGGAMLLIALAYFLWYRNVATKKSNQHPDVIHS